MLNPTPSNSRLQPHPIANPDGELADISLQSLFESEESNLLRYAYSLTGRRAVAEEIVQDVFMQLHACWSKVDSPRAWLYRSVRNRGFNHLRKSKRETLQSDDEQMALPVDAKEESPETMMSRMETTVQLRQLLGELVEGDQQLIRLKYFEGLKYREISERTGLSIGNVGYRLHQIMQRLASQLRPREINDSK